MPKRFQFDNIDQVKEANPAWFKGRGATSKLLPGGFFIDAHSTKLTGRCTVMWVIDKQGRVETVGGILAWATPKEAFAAIKAMQDVILGES